MFRSIRARLTLWYVTVLGLVLIAFSVGGYLLLARTLYDRLDARLASTLQASVSTLKPALGEATNFDAIERGLQELPTPNQTIAVLDSEQRVIAQKTSAGGPPLRLPPSPLNPSESIGFYELPEFENDGPESESEADDGSRGAFQRVPGTPPLGGYTVVVVQSLEPVIDQLELLQNFLLIAVPLILLLAGLGGWLLAREPGAGGGNVRSRNPHQRRQPRSAAWGGESARRAWPSGDDFQ